MAVFHYFGYASNLSPYKVGLRCKTCKRYGLGQLPDRALVFGKFSEEWKGGTATMQEKTGSVIWGVIWEIDSEEMHILDDQEGVSSGNYRALNVDVVDPSGKTIKCRVYQQVVSEDSTTHCQPSPQYLDVILEGARISKLPSDYIAMLEATETNGNTVLTDLMREIENKKKAI